MMNTKVHILVIEYQWERTLLRILLIILAFLTIAYVYFAVSSILNVIAHKEAVAQAAQIESDIGILEQQYFTISQGLTPEVGNALGLSPLATPQYIYRHGNVGKTAITHTQI
jgi:presenilin-like A22 family membrane protease